jgi:hypothetical protein
VLQRDKSGRVAERKRFVILDIAAFGDGRTPADFFEPGQKLFV